MVFRRLYLKKSVVEDCFGFGVKTGLEDNFQQLRNKCGGNL